MLLSTGWGNPAKFRHGLWPSDVAHGPPPPSPTIFFSNFRFPFQVTTVTKCTRGTWNSAACSKPSPWRARPDGCRCGSNLCRRGPNRRMADAMPLCALCSDPPFTICGGIRWAGVGAVQAANWSFSYYLGQIQDDSLFNHRLAAKIPPKKVEGWQCPSFLPQFIQDLVLTKNNKLTKTLPKCSVGLHELGLAQNARLHL